jgi:hypothetical protein
MWSRMSPPLELVPSTLRLNLKQMVKPWTKVCVLAAVEGTALLSIGVAPPMIVFWLDKLRVLDNSLTVVWQLLGCQDEIKAVSTKNIDTVVFHVISTLFVY